MSTVSKWPVSSNGASSGVPSLPTAADIPANFEGVMRVGGDLYVGANGALANWGERSIRQVATSCGNFQGVTAGAVAVMARSRHFMRSDCKSIGVVFENVYFTGQGTTERGQGGTLTVKASIERQDGTIIPLTFSGTNSYTIPNGGFIQSDIANTNLLNGEYFWVRAHYQFGYGRMWSSRNDSAKPGDTNAFGEGVEIAGVSGATGADKTGQSGALSNQGAGWGVILPKAIVGMSKEPAVALMGDSRTFGYSAGNDPDSSIGSGIFADFGYARSVGPLVAYANYGYPGDCAARASAGVAAKRIATINSYFTHVVCNYGFNDLNGVPGGEGQGAVSAQTSTQVIANLKTLYGLFNPRIKIFQTTISPATTDATNTVTIASNAERLLLNTALRKADFIRGGIIDVANVTESSITPGLWKQSSYSSDGVHESKEGNLVIKNSGIFHAGLFSMG